MTIRDIPALKREGSAALADCGAQKKLAVVYAGGLVALPLVLTVLDLILSHMISGTGGLSNLGTKTLLSSLQTMLPFLQTLVLLGWNAGYTMAMMRILRRQEADHTTLLSGFSLFFPMLRTMLLEGLLYFNILVLSFLLSTQLYSFTPWARDMILLLEPYLPAMMEDPTAVILENAVLMEVLVNMIPMLLLFAGLYFALAIPLSYRLRMRHYCLIDAPGAGAMRAMAMSRRIMRRNCWNLFRVDLSFWWYHGLLFLVGMIPMLPLMGFTLPLGPDFTYYLCYGGYLTIEFAVGAFLRNRVEAVYAAAYETLREKPKETAVVLGNIFDMG